MEKEFNYKVVDTFKRYKFGIRFVSIQESLKNKRMNFIIREIKMNIWA